MRRCVCAYAFMWSVCIYAGLTDVFVNHKIFIHIHPSRGPGLCVSRVPNNGRTFEYLSGEDPVLGAELVGPLVRAIQAQGVIAVGKHWVNNQQETNRTYNDAIVDEQTVRIFLSVGAFSRHNIPPVYWHHAHLRVVISPIHHHDGQHSTQPFSMQRNNTTCILMCSLVICICTFVANISTFKSTPTHSLTHSLTHLLTHSLTHSLPHHLPMLIMRAPGPKLRSS